MTWSREDDLWLAALWRSATPTGQIARQLNTTIGAVESRAAIRQLGARKTYKTTLNGRERAEARGDTPPLTDTRDADHVALCLSQGGFPTTCIIGGKTVWVWPYRRAA